MSKKTIKKFKLCTKLCLYERTFCTDKTGTLTQDKVVLEYHLDIHGNEG